jgi:hypothetical protein
MEIEIRARKSERERDQRKTLSIALVMYACSTTSALSLAALGAVITNRFSDIFSHLTLSLYFPLSALCPLGSLRVQKFLISRQSGVLYGNH